MSNRRFVAIVVFQIIIMTFTMGLTGIAIGSYYERQKYVADQAQFTVSASLSPVFSTSPQPTPTMTPSASINVANKNYSYLIPANASKSLQNTNLGNSSSNHASHHGGSSDVISSGGMNAQDMYAMMESNGMPQAMQDGSMDQMMIDMMPQMMEIMSDNMKKMMMDMMMNNMTNAMGSNTTMTDQVIQMLGTLDRMITVMDRIINASIATGTLDNTTMTQAIDSIDRMTDMMNQLINMMNVSNSTLSNDAINQKVDEASAQAPDFPFNSNLGPTIPPANISNVLPGNLNITEWRPLQIG